MTRVVINGVDRPGAADHKTWGELLAVVDNELKGSGQVVTATRFDSVDTPTYRDQAQLHAPLERFSRVEIDAAPTAALLRQGLSEAAGALETLCEAAARIGLDFRGQDVAAANKQLVSLAQSLSTLVTLIGVVGQALSVDFDTFTVSGEKAQTLFEETGTQIGSMVQAQQQEDWIAVADTLEHDVSPTLARWRGLLAALHEQAGAGAAG